MSTRGTPGDSRAAKQTWQIGIAFIGARFSQVIGTRSSHVSRRPGRRDFPESRGRIYDNPLERGSSGRTEFESRVTRGIGAVVLPLLVPALCLCPAAWIFAGG